MTPVPRTRDEAIELLQVARWDPRPLSLTEKTAFRALYHLDGDRTDAERLQAEPTENLSAVPLPRGARLIGPRNRHRWRT